MLSRRIDVSLKCAVLAIIATVLVLPGLQMVFPAFDELPVQEYRNFAQAPKEISFYPIKRYKEARRKFDDWFNDHVGFRSTMLRVGGQISFSIFHDAALVYIGQRDWLYMKVFYDGARNASISTPPQEELRYFQPWLTLRDWLAARGIHLIVVDIPLKHMLYSEFLPPKIAPMPSVTIWDRFRSYMDQHGIDRLDVGPILREAKSRGEVYLKYDIHWSTFGGCVTAEKLVDKIGKLETGRDRTWKINYKIKPGAPIVGTEARALPLLRNLSESLDVVEPDGLKGYAYQILTPTNPYDFVHKNDGGGLLPTTVSLNDSFFEFMQHCGLGNHFTQLYSARTIASQKEVTGILPVLKSIPPGTKYFIMEYMENNLTYVMPPDVIFPN